MRTKTRLLRVGLALAIGVVMAMPASAQPRIQLKVPPFPGIAFPNFSAVILPPTGYPALEIWVEDALAAIQVSTVRIKLNDMPMTPFVAINPLPGGVRAILKLGVTLSPDYTLRKDGENEVTFEATDTAKIAYRGRFYLTVDPAATAPKLAPVRRPSKEVVAPTVKLPPEIKFTSAWQTRTHDTTALLTADVSDAEGLTRVVIEVNGKDLEEIQIENERPVRKRDGFIARASLPGEVEGDSRHLTISVPIPLPKNIVVVAIRAVNALGLRTRIDRVITRD
jgi:hypothetical protein